tara:strand:+ start:162 stop:293 length:132 start_codon:yes stop_codon:yes gene_type:complete
MEERKFRINSDGVSLVAQNAVSFGTQKILFAAIGTWREAIEHG